MDHVLRLANFRLRMLLTTCSGSPSLSLHLGSLLAQDCLARKANAIAFDGEHFDQDLIAFFQLIANIFDAMLGNFADVQQAVGAGKDLDERTEISEAYNLAEIRFADLRSSG